MDIYGLLGYPLGHSFSSRYFTEKFSAQHIAAEYRNFEFADLSEAIEHLKSISGLRGFNVTIPYKELVIPYLNKLSPEAAEIGAVNVVKVRINEKGDLSLHGFNTDVMGFRRSICKFLNKETHRKALVLGTGGASKAVVYGLHQSGIQTRCVSRQESKGQLTYHDLTRDIMREHLVIVNCTPLGMYPNTEDAPDIPYEHVGPEHVLFDLVYNPLNTQFMIKGKQNGAVVTNGLEMLHLQADAAWDIWRNDKI